MSGVGGKGTRALRLVSAEQSGQIESHLAAVLDRLLHADGLSAMNRVIREYVLAGGKRVRPQLCLWTYERIGGSVPPTPDSCLLTPVLDVACAWELFHAFLLAHDDIIDSAETRREQRALHHQLAQLDSNCPKFGTNLGIVAGDLLFSAAMRLWHDIDAPPLQYRALLRLFGRVATITGFGQAIDICQSHVELADVDEETLLREYHWKTAAYTFEGPMLSGAILAGADDATQAAISQFGLALGQAYQLQNDLLDLTTAAHEGSDIVQGKRTIALVSARRQMNESRRIEFDRKVAALSSANGQTLVLADEIRRELLDFGAADRTRDKVNDFLTTARAAAESRELSESLRGGMLGLLDSLQTQYFERAKLSS